MSNTNDKSDDLGLDDLEGDSLPLTPSTGASVSAPATPAAPVAEASSDDEDESESSDDGADDVSDADAERSNLELQEEIELRKELEARDAAAKVVYEKALAESEADKAKVDERGPTVAVKSIEAPWQSGPEAVRPDQDKVETGVQVEVKVEPSVIISPSLAPPAPAPAPQPAPVNSMPGQVRTQIRVGRAPDNDWVIANPNVSSHHAMLSLNEGSIKVEDLGSTHGTFVADASGNWTRIVQGSPATVQIGQRLRFASVEITSSHDAQRQTHLHFIEQPAQANQPAKLSPSMTPPTDGEQLSEMHRKEQARLNAVEAAKPRPALTPSEVLDAQAVTKSPTSMQQSIARGNTSGSGLGRVLGIGTLVIAAMAVLLFGLHWAANHLDFGRGDVVADTETETSTESETPSPDPTETAETETPTPTVEPITVGTTYACRPGSEVSSCHRVADFLLARADGAAYWDCSNISREQYHDLYTVEDPSGDRNIVMNTCACQLCEPTAMP